ncbi:MAG: hypothetical protein WCY98_02880 [Castellaniella sp.]
MLHFIPLARGRFAACFSLMLAAGLLGGCASERAPGYYDPPRESTLTDAQQQAVGRRSARAPSQLQLGFGETEAEKARAEREAAREATLDAQAPAGQRHEVRELLEARSFLGTVPCVTPNVDCPASRIMLTLAPGGEWRARTTLLGGASVPREPIVQRGCWEVSGEDPLRIVLRTEDGQTRAGFVFVNDHLLRVTRYNDIRPTLDYHLTRQADLDPIDEMAGLPPLQCH